MEQQISRIDDLLASHTWEPWPTNMVRPDDSNPFWSGVEAAKRENQVIGHQKDIHNTTCITSGKYMQEEQSIGIYYILKGKKRQHCNWCEPPSTAMVTYVREFILAPIVWEYGVGITVEGLA